MQRPNPETFRGMRIAIARRIDCGRLLLLDTCKAGERYVIAVQRINKDGSWVKHPSQVFGADSITEALSQFRSHKAAA